VKHLFLTVILLTSFSLASAKNSAASGKDSPAKEDFKKLGKSFADLGLSVGKKAKKSGLEVGEAAKEAGLKIGKTAEEFGTNAGTAAKKSAENVGGDAANTFATGRKFLAAAIADASKVISGFAKNLREGTAKEYPSK
jgi:hypothetical protein